MTSNSLGSFPMVVSHLDGALMPTPRGSIAMISKLSAIAFPIGRPPVAKFRICVDAGAPGPPGLMNRLPTRWPFAGILTMLSCTCSPPGWSCTIGTERLAHWRPRAVSCGKNGSTVGQGTKVTFPVAGGVCLRTTWPCIEGTIKRSDARVLEADVGQYIVPVSVKAVIRKTSVL